MPSSLISQRSARPGSIARSLPRFVRPSIDMPEMGDRGGLVEGIGIERLQVALVGIAQGHGHRRHGGAGHERSQPSRARNFERIVICRLSPLEAPRLCAVFFLLGSPDYCRVPSAGR